jgi:hypothetical protein
MLALILVAMLTPAWAQAPGQSTQNLEVLALVGAQMGAT